MLLSYIVRKIRINLWQNIMKTIKEKLSGCYATPLKHVLIKLNESKSEVKMNLKVVTEAHWTERENVNVTL